MFQDHTDESGPPANQVMFELPCRSCEYNLKTINLESMCPECGEPVMATIAIVTEQGRIRFERMTEPGPTFAACAELTGLAFDTVSLIWTALAYFREIGVDRYQLKVAEKPMGAISLCFAIRDVSRVVYGDNPRTDLESLHLATAEQVRDVLVILVSHGLLKKFGAGQWSDFESDDCPDPANT